jgi:NAD(P)-dependent dehydrogenase (short-subunit alcohol dehydrogenase family)
MGRPIASRDRVPARVEPRGRHVVITGGASGIGRALALRFADEGARVTVADLDEDGAAAVAEQAGGAGFACDVGVEADLRALTASAEQAHGPIDMFVSNAGITGPTGGPEIGDDAWDQLWRVNVMAHVWAARAVLPGMLARGEGYLISTASAAGLVAQVGALGYTVTKHAAVSVAEWLAITYGAAGIRVSCLCPQYVRTPMVMEGDLDVALLEQVAEVLEPEQVADAVIDGVREERFLILPHPEVAKYMAIRGAEHERWLAGMRRLSAQMGAQP